MSKKGLSLLWKLVICVVAPCLLLGAVALPGALYSVKRTADMVNTEYLSSYTELARVHIESTIEGEYNLQGTSLYLGDLELSTMYAFLDDLSVKTGVDMTIFYGDTRYVTTLRTETGERNVGTKSKEGIWEVVKTGESYFVPSVDIGGEDFSGYYAPLYNSDSVVGMIFSGIPNSVTHSVYKEITSKVVLVAILSLVLSILVSAFFAVRLTKEVISVTEDLSIISTGDLTLSVDNDSNNRADEIGKMRRSLKTLVGNLLNMLRGIFTTSSSLGSISTRLTDTFGVISSSMQSISEVSEEMVRGSLLQAEETSNATSEVQIIGDSIDELNKSFYTLLDANTELVRMECYH